MSEEKKDYAISVRFNAEEMARFDAVKLDIESRTSGHFRVTYKTVLLEALDAVEKQIAERKRPRRKTT